MNEGFAEISLKLNGIILRKAELENDFEKVYLKIFERIVQMENFGSEDPLEIFGNLGG